MSSRSSSKQKSSRSTPTTQQTNNTNSSSSSSAWNQVVQQQQTSSPSNNSSSSSKQKTNNKGGRRGRHRRRSDNGNQSSSQQPQHNGTKSPSQTYNDNQQAAVSSKDDMQHKMEQLDIQQGNEQQQQQQQPYNSWEQQQQSQQHLYPPPAMSNSSNQGGAMTPPTNSQQQFDTKNNTNLNEYNLPSFNTNNNAPPHNNNNNNWHLHSNQHPNFAQQQLSGGMMSHPNNFPIQYNNNNPMPSPLNPHYPQTSVNNSNNQYPIMQQQMPPSMPYEQQHSNNNNGQQQQFQFNNNNMGSISHSNNNMPPNNMPPNNSMPQPNNNNDIINSKYIYKWDNNNIIHFIEVRNQMLDLLFGNCDNGSGNVEGCVDNGSGKSGLRGSNENRNKNGNRRSNDNNNTPSPSPPPPSSNNNNFVKSHSDNAASLLLMSPTRPMSPSSSSSRLAKNNDINNNKNSGGGYKRASSVGSGTRNALGEGISGSDEVNRGMSMPILDNNSPMRHQQQQQQLPRQQHHKGDGRISSTNNNKRPTGNSRGINGNSSQGGPEGLGFTSPRSSPISNNNKVINLESSATSNNNQERTVLEKLNEMLPPTPTSSTTISNTNHFITAIRSLFLDSSLPLAGYPSSSTSGESTSTANNTHHGTSSTQNGESEKTIITPHPLSSSSTSTTNNSSTIINLIPKTYLISWINYVRNVILIENIQCYFMAWERVDLQSQQEDQDRGSSRGGSSRGGDGNEEPPPEMPIREGGNSGEGIERGNKGGTAIDRGSNIQGQGEHTNGEGQGPWRHPAGDSSSSESEGEGGEGGEGDNTSTRYYTLLPETIKVLATLSILSDQYQLHQDTNYNTTGNQQQHEFVHWLEELMYCWNCWVDNVIEFRLHMEATQGQGKGSPPGIRHPQGPGNSQESCPPHGFTGDEKKHEDYSLSQQQYHHQPPPHFLHPHHPSHSAGSSPPHLLHRSSSSHSFQQQPPIPYPAPYPHYTFPPYQQPGPVDCRVLTTIEYPLIMHEHVMLSMRGLLGCDAADSTADGYGNDDKVAICPVSTGFYELLRNSQGVICSSDDKGGEHPISYCPPLSYVNDPQGSTSGGMNGAPPNKSSTLCSLLFHDQWKVNDISTPSSTTTDGNATPNKNNSRTGSPNGSGDDDDGYPLFALSPDAHQDVNQGYQQPYPYANNDEANIFPKLQQSNQIHVRPIEFQRRLLSVPISKDDDMIEEESSSSPGRNGYLNAAKKKKDTPSPYSRLMQEALASKKSMDQEADGNSSVSSSAINLAVDTTSTKEKSVGYTVEVFPVEFKYVIVDEDAGGVSSVVATDDNTTGLPQHSHQGIALASRTSSISEVLHDLQRAAVPYKPNSCVRIWKRSVCNEATKNGDGYDLLDDASLFAEPPVSSPKSTSSKSKQLVVEELTIEQWLGMVPLNSKTAKEQACTPGHVVELLIEVRSSPTSKWIRESLELENRVQPGDYVDAQDSARKWYEAVVREVKPDTIKVHYFGWGSKWDYELPRRQGTKSKLSPPVPLWTKTAQWRNQIKVGQEVEVRESTSLVQRPKWHRATVLAVGDENDMPRDLEGGAELELIDVNDVGAKIPLNLLKRRRQILVDVPQEIPNLPTATPLTPPRNRNGSVMPVAQPPYRRWVNLYGEEVCKVNTHKTSNKTPSKSPTTLNYTMETQRAPVEVMKPFNNIHGSGFVRESLRGIPPATGVVGLHNLGNSCYMNSILQCINHIKPITQYFLKGDYINEINKRNPLGTGGRIATAYANFLNDIYSNDYSILAPRILKQTVSVYAPQFNNNYQHDSQEFCQYIFDGLHEDLNRVKEKPYVEDVEAFGMEDSKAAMESWKNHLLRHDSIFVDHTQGMHRSHLTCPKCGRESIKFDVYSSISLPLVPAKERSSIPLKDCLDQFAAGEQLDSHNAWYCATCKKHVCALKLITLWNTPDVLVLHLKRFTYEKCPDIDGRLLRRKIEDRVDFPIDRLDLSSYVLGPIDPEAPPIYKLFGVSEHMGTTQTSGHYTATVRNSEDGNWYRYNDSQVGSTSGDAAVTGGAYLLFYQRAKGSLKWAGMEKEIRLEGGYVDSDGFAVVGKKKNKKK